MDRLLPASH